MIKIKILFFVLLPLYKSQTTNFQLSCVSSNHWKITYMPLFLSNIVVSALTLHSCLPLQQYTRVHIHSAFAHCRPLGCWVISFELWSLAVSSSQGTCYFLISTQVCENLSHCCFHYTFSIIILSSRNKFISKPLGKNDKKQSILFPCLFIRLEMSRKI